VQVTAHLHERMHAARPL